MTGSAKYGRRKFLRRSAMLGGSLSVTTAFIPVQGAPAAKGSPPPPGPGRLKKARDDVEVYRDPKYYCGPGPSPLVLPGGTAIVAYYFNSVADGGKQRHIVASFLREA